MKFDNLEFFLLILILLISFPKTLLVILAIILGPILW